MTKMNESYWTYRAPAPPETPPPDSKMTQAAWYSLSPGMRREIWRSYERRQKRNERTL
ncbi:hypothetical protein PHIN3_4 [Sinorhizobium phage phiN3]|uniref:Uncharacterized protein n=1 Tax=Sinorhizobium phage phiN3 TaxID=1647405 RepID=A0A0F6WCD2_9CAUD|nr:hypothetical protein AVT40_gp004 [Sinorhizobium phage phiN3]AKF13271.1 hypothetical protein PHIN3_4 [Sinorhizobium phage phiN3]